MTAVVSAFSAVVTVVLIGVVAFGTRRTWVSCRDWCGTVILGAAATLRVDSMADDDMARRLLGATESSARLIEAETLLPERRVELERELT